MFKIFIDAAGQYRWNLSGLNGRIIAASAEGYRSKADCEAGIRLVRTLAPGAPIHDVTVARSTYGRS